MATNIYAKHAGPPGTAALLVQSPIVCPASPPLPSRIRSPNRVRAGGLRRAPARLGAVSTARPLRPPQPPATNQRAPNRPSGEAPRHNTDSDPTRALFLYFAGHSSAANTGLASARGRLHWHSSIVLAAWRFSQKKRASPENQKKFRSRGARYQTDDCGAPTDSPYPKGTLGRGELEI